VERPAKGTPHLPYARVKDAGYMIAGTGTIPQNAALDVIESIQAPGPCLVGRWEIYDGSQ